MLILELGSSTLKILLIDSLTNKKSFQCEKVVNVADGLTARGDINNEACLRVVNAIKDISLLINFENYKIKAVATEALRKAHNQYFIIKNIYKNTGILFEVLSSDDEAKFTFLAVKNKVDMFFKQKSFVVIDIGGASTEIIFYYPKQNKIISKSFSFGVISLYNKEKNRENCKITFFKNAKKVFNFVNYVYKKYGKVNRFVATSGPPIVLSKIKFQNSLNDYNGTIVKIKELDILLNNFIFFKSKNEYIDELRSQSLHIGVYIFKYLYKILNFDEALIITDGLIDGISISFFAHSHPS